MQQRRRKYRSGTKWCIWRWTDVTTEYITRLHLIKTPWFAVCLHWLNKPDPEPYLHDHPVSFLSIILRGWYCEERWNPELGLHATNNKWYNLVKASPDDRHSITWVGRNTLTLCFMGPKTREWGYHVPDSEGLEWAPYKAPGTNWVYWKDYEAKRNRENGQGLAGVRRGDEEEGGGSVRTEAQELGQQQGS